MPLPQVNGEALLETFLALARLDSPSGAEGPVRDYLRERLNALGVESQTDAAGNLLADLPANDCAHDAVLIVSGHMDVVPPCLGVQPVVRGEGEARWVESDGSTVLGADDKAALASILEAVALSLRHHSPRPRLRLIFTVCEETHLAGARQLTSQALEARFALTFDHTGAPGTVILKAPTLTTFEIVFTGRTSHAGIAPESGVSALTLAARALSRMRQGRLDADSTANFAQIEGGQATNIVPDRVVVCGELRSHNPQMIVDELAAMEIILAEESAAMPGSGYHLTYETAFEGYALPDDHPMVARVCEAIRAQGLTPRLIATNGGSDNNVFMARGLEGLVLSAAMEGPHTLAERASLADMTQTARLLLALWEAFAREPF